MSEHRIVVGVDGSRGSRAALAWAVSAAADRGASVHAVSAWRADSAQLSAPGKPDRETARRVATDELTHQIDGLPADQRAAVPITQEIREGPAVEVLVEAARDADLLVLGSHGHGRLWHTMVGWTTEECARKAPCPVVMVPLRSRREERRAERSARRSRA